MRYYGMANVGYEGLWKGRTTGRVLLNTFKFDLYPLSFVTPSWFLRQKLVEEAVAEDKI